MVKIGPGTEVLGVELRGFEAPDPLDCRSQGTHPNDSV